MSYPFQGPDDPADRAVGGEFNPRGSVADRRRAYRDLVREMDAGVGEVLDALEAHGIADRTLVWFYSDNGAAQWGSNGPLRGLKATDWECGHRVPSIAVWPGRIPAGTESDQLVSTLDVMPTLLSLVDAGAGAPPGNVGATTLPAFDGVDLSPILLRKEALPRATTNSIPGQARDRITSAPERAMAPEMRTAISAPDCDSPGGLCSAPGPPTTEKHNTENTIAPDGVAQPGNRTGRP